MTGLEVRLYCHDDLERCLSALDFVLIFSDNLLSKSVDYLRSAYSPTTASELMYGQAVKGSFLDPFWRLSDELEGFQGPTSIVECLIWFRSDSL